MWERLTSEGTRGFDEAMIDKDFILGDQSPHASANSLERLEPDSSLPVLCPP
jgi:hypothetical protein